MKKVFIFAIFTLLLYANKNPLDLDYNKKLCLENNSSGCYTVGMIFYAGYKETEKDHFKAVEYLDKACSLGTVEACGQLGYIFLDDKYIPKDIPRSISLLKPICNERNVSVACMAVATGYDKQKDYKQAFKYYDKACQLNHYGGCNAVAYMYAAGERFGLARDYTKAIAYYEKGCAPNRPKDSIGSCRKHSLKALRIMQAHSKD